MNEKVKSFRKTLPILTSEASGSQYQILTVRDEYIALGSKAGMFCELRAPSQKSRLFKPISIMDVADGCLSFMIKILGEGTRALAALRPGDVLDIIGPLGHGFPILTNRKALLVSGGVGYPPLAMLKKALPSSTSYLHLHGGTSVDDIFPCDLASTVDGSKGHQGLVTDLVPELIRKHGIDLVYSCGPLPMLAALQALCPSILHFTSLEAYMVCGIGVCYGCAVPTLDGYQRVCKEGPVFDARLINWEEIC